MELSRLWVGMLTRNLEDAGTDSSITLTISVGADDRLNYTFPDTKQIDQERAEANLYGVGVAGRNIIPSQLTDSSIRIGILGSDAWSPKHFMVWGEQMSDLGTNIIPLAIETDITTQLSTDQDEGPASLPLRLVRTGEPNMLMRRLLILILTRGAAEGGGIFTEPNTVFGTESPLEIQVVSRDRLVVLFEISETSQMDLDTGYANFYTVPVIVPFSKGDLDDSSVTLRLKGLDIWEPASFFLFGLDTAAGRPEAIVPLVHLPEWPFGFMEADATNGVASINLPLLSGQSAPID